MKKFKLSVKAVQVEQTVSAIPHQLYEILKLGDYKQYPYEKQVLGEGMYVINQVIGEYWKPRFLVDGKNKTAVEFMSGSTKLQTVCVDDIDWKSLEGLPPYAIDRAKYLDAVFPTFVRGYKNGIAEVSWQINPDGYYYMDEDGFGMTDDEEITIYSYVDRAGKPLVKFQTIKDYGELDIMRKEAKNNLKKRTEYEQGLSKN